MIPGVEGLRLDYHIHMLNVRVKRIYVVEFLKLFFRMGHEIYI